MLKKAMVPRSNKKPMIKVLANLKNEVSMSLKLHTKNNKRMAKEKHKKMKI
jgi:hypothetical protein